MAQFLGFMDMIDGGGAGAVGSEFKGGGLLSDIANSLFSPRGSMNRIAPQERPQGVMGQAMQPMQAQSAPMQPPVSQGINTPQVNTATLDDLQALYAQMVKAGMLPPMAPQMQQGPF